MATCKLCQSETDKLVKSHIIPRAFYCQREGKGIDSIFVGGNQHPKRSRDGIYSKIVCSHCEGLFSRWDDYAVSLLKQTTPDNIARAPSLGQVLAFEYRDINYDFLKRFCLSLLWRIHTSKHDFFHSLTLNSEQVNNLSKILLSESLIAAEEWAVFIGKNTHELNYYIRPPEVIRQENSLYAKIYFPQHVVIVQLQGIEIPQELILFLLYPGTGLIAFHHDIEVTGDLDDAYNIARQHFEKS